jgi:hypothetical protein
MKKINYLFTLICLFISSYSFSQTLSYEDIERTNGKIKTGFFQSYVSSNGVTFNVGDKITIGVPSEFDGGNRFFTSIDRRNAGKGSIYKVGDEIINIVVEIKYINYNKFFFGKSAAFNATIVNGQSCAFCDYYLLRIENALSVGEVKALNGKLFFYSSDEALSELKKAKDKLDLGLITQEEFNSIKTELSKYIK